MSSIEDDGILLKLKNDVVKLFHDNISIIINKIELEHGISIDRDAVIPKELITLKKDYDSKHKLSSSVIPDLKINILKCRAITLSGEQCSRNIKNSTLFCGSHITRRPHGEFK